MNDGAGPVTGDNGTPSGAARRAADALVGLMIAQRYRIERTVSVGAHTVITDATDTEVGRLVTLKLVRPEFSEDPDFRRRFDQAMRAMSGLSHPNIAAIYDWGETEVSRRTTMFAVVEYLGGGSLRDLFDRGRWLSPSQALTVGLEACRALDYAHRRQIAHSEITPSKLVFGDDRRLRIVDFGLARLLGLAAWRDPATVATHTARYASPEQALGQPISGKTDVYALALCMVEAVKGSVPFAADSTVATLTGRIGKLMPVSADLGSLASVLERAARPEPADRWTAAEFGRALVQAAASLPRPEALPLLTTTVFDEQQLRRPSDPTGGIERPSDPVVVVPVSDETRAADEHATGSGEAGAIGHQEIDTEPAVDTAAPMAAVPADAVEDEVPAVEGDTPQVADEIPQVEGQDEVPVEDADPAAADEVEAAPLAGPSRPALYDGGADVPDDEDLDIDRERHGPDIVPPVPPVATEPAGAGPQDPGPPVAGGGDNGGRRRWPRLVLAVVLLGVLGALAYLAFSLFATPRHEVPDLAGSTEAAARAAVADFDWKIELRRERSDEEPDKGEIIRTSPRPGDDLAEGDPFLLVISKGPELREVPDVVGMSDADARTALAKLELKSAKTDPVFHERVPKGSVVSWAVRGRPDIEAGDGVLPGARVQLTLSKGPKPREVPALFDMPVRRARQTVKDLRLRLERTKRDTFHMHVEKGNIAKQWPEPGRKLDRGGTVRVLVSKGPDYRKFPDLSGLNVNRAVAKLERAGYKRGQILGAGNRGTFRNACIDGETVDPGQEFVRGTRVHLVFLTPDAEDREGTVFCSGF